MTDTATIPDQPEAVTAPWLSAVLQASHPGVSVTGTHVLAQDSGTTGRMRLRLEYGNGPAGPESVFVKLPPFDESQRRLVAKTDMGRREARFYAGPGVEAPLRIPRPYFAAFGDEPTEYVMVLEDLVASGARLTTRAAPLDEDETGLLVRALAGLHAHFWEDPRFDDELSWVQPAMRGSYGAKLVAGAQEQFAADFPPVFDDLCRTFIEHHERIAELWDVGAPTLIHGDTHAGNLFVDGDEVGVYDWAVISRSPGIRDLAIHLGNSCPAELRSAHQEQWIRGYRDVLVGAGIDAPDFDELWLQYRITVLYAWVAATTTASMGSRWQPIEVGMAGMTRATETCADLETVEAITGAL